MPVGIYTHIYIYGSLKIRRGCCEKGTKVKKKKKLAKIGKLEDTVKEGSISVNPDSVLNTHHRILPIIYTQ